MDQLWQVAGGPAALASRMWPVLAMALLLWLVVFRTAQACPKARWWRTLPTAVMAGALAGAALALLLPWEASALRGLPLPTLALVAGLAVAALFWPLAALRAGRRAITEYIVLNGKPG